MLTISAYNIIENLDGYYLTNILILADPSTPVCKDISMKCQTFKKYCGMNDYVTQRCQQTCGICSKFR